ncbi:MAG: hypothetical protein KGH75_00010 [Rhodospirillales bacterium]|nr:hypothetical protein [Rhodospirillales bacterium]
MTAPKRKTTGGRTTPRGTTAKRAGAVRKAPGRTEAAERPAGSRPDPQTLEECDREIAARQQAIAAIEQQRTRLLAELNYLSGVRATGIRLGGWTES